MADALTMIRHHHAVWVCRMPPHSRFEPDLDTPFLSWSRSPAETSLVIAGAAPTDAEKVEGPWTAFELAGPIPFTVVGLFARLTGRLAAAGIPVFIISTFDTDWLFVKDEWADRAAAVFEADGIVVVRRGT